MNPQQTETYHRLKAIHDRYLHCLELTRQALEVDALSDGNRLSDILRDRAEALTRIRHLESGFDAGATSPGPDDEGRIEALRRKTGETVRALAAADRALHAGLEAARDRTAEELARIRQGQAVLKAYAPFRGAGGRYFDLEG